MCTASTAELEELRLLVKLRAPLARAMPQAEVDTRHGGQRFRLRSGTSVYVMSPTTPGGKRRDRLGLWKYQIGREPWLRARSIDTVVAFIHRESQRLIRPDVKQRRHLAALTSTRQCG